LDAILDASIKGDCPVDVRVVISNKADAPALRIARDAGVSAFFINPSHYLNREDFDMACVELIEAHECQWVVLAGYMRILSPAFVAHFDQRLVNIHPSLLPAFAGSDGVGDALRYGVKIAGCTVHLVDEDVDSGPILAQAAVPVLNHDTKESLHQRIHEQEYKLYPDTLRRMVEDGFVVEGRRVIWNDKA